AAAIVTEVLIERLVVREVQVESDVTSELELIVLHQSVFGEDVAECLEVVPLVAGEKRERDGIGAELELVVRVVPRGRVKRKVGEGIFRRVRRIGRALIDANDRRPDQRVTDDSRRVSLR